MKLNKLNKLKKIDPIKILMYLLSIGIISYLIIYGDIAKIIEEIKNISLELVLILLILTFLYTFLRIYRFYFLIRKKYAISLGSLTPIFCYGIALSNFVPGRFSEPIRAYLLKRKKFIPFTFSMACVFFERLSDVLILFLFSSILFLFLKIELFALPFILVFLILFTVIIATQNEKIYFSLVKILEHVLNILKGFNIRIKIFDEILMGIKNLHKEIKISKNFFVPLVISILIWIIDALTFYLPLISLGEKVDFFFVLGVYSFSLLVGLITLLPGGFGSVEASMVFLLTYAGINYQKAMISIILGRFFGLGLLMIYGTIMPPFITEEKIKKVKSNKK